MATHGAGHSFLPGASVTFQHQHCAPRYNIGLQNWCLNWDCKGCVASISWPVARASPCFWKSIRDHPPAWPCICTQGKKMPFYGTLRPVQGHCPPPGLCQIQQIVWPCVISSRGRKGMFVLQTGPIGSMTPRIRHAVTGLARHCVPSWQMVQIARRPWRDSGDACAWHDI